MFFKKISLSRFSVKRTDLSAVTMSLAAGGDNPITLAQMYLGLWGSTVQSQQCEAWCFPTMQVDLQELSKKLCQDRFYFSGEEVKPLPVAVYSEKCYAPSLTSLASPSPGCSNTIHCSRLSKAWCNYLCLNESLLKLPKDFRLIALSYGVFWETCPAGQPSFRSCHASPTGPTDLWSTPLLMLSI